ncbi:MAG: aspartate--tRNA ligase [Spirochaetota bacterium]|nr:aspartate--tRNA ligase [Spirochaetota bacterium]
MLKERSYCGELSILDIGKRVLLCGWVAMKRDLGGIIFIQLRDVTGIIQVLIDSSNSSDMFSIAEEIKSEYCILARGLVRRRFEDNINPDLVTGELEIVVDHIEILNTSNTPPIPLEFKVSVSEDMRLRYRYLDLRREDMREAIIKRHILMQSVRKYLSQNRFLEIETPILNKSTPEGARDFLVPSRINKGMFYALPQSPQLFKQILMVSGFDRYFQITKCFRDEDLRYDRQPEFTQIDIEMSFIVPDDIIEIIEELLRDMVKDVIGKEIKIPFQRISYDNAIARFGTDAPDMRFDIELIDCSDIFQNTEFKVFESALSGGGIVKGIAISDQGKISRKTIEEYTEYVRAFKAKGLPWIRCKDGSFVGGISKFINEEQRVILIERFNIQGNTIVFFSSDSQIIVNDTLANLRKRIADDLDLINKDELNFLWVTDFPLLEYNNDEKRFFAKHHPFTSPMPAHIDLLDSINPDNVERVKSQAYDIVLNGVEIGGGSIRISNIELQKKMFSILGIPEEEYKQKFSFLIEALGYGAPPHGGIALGLDRILMLLINRDSIRDVIPFPKTHRGQCLMSEAPAHVSLEQLKELGIRVVER